MTLSRVIFESQDGIARLTILCGGCLNALASRCREEERKFVLRAYGNGDGFCEICSGEIRSMVEDGLND